MFFGPPHLRRLQLVGSHLGHEILLLGFSLIGLYAILIPRFVLDDAKVAIVALRRPFHPKNLFMNKLT